MNDTFAPAPPRTRAARDWRLWLALATVYLVWGSTYLAVRVMVRTIPPLLGSGVRFLVAGAVLYPFLVARRGWAGVRVPTREAGAASLVGILFLAGFIGLLLILVADASMAVASFASSRLPVPGDTLVATALELLAAGFVLCAA